MTFETHLHSQNTTCETSILISICHTNCSWPTFLDKYLFLFYVFGCFAGRCNLCIMKCNTHRDQEGAPDSLERALTDGCEQPSGLWEPNPRSLRDHQVLLTTDSSFQSMSP